jgi:hypothetical protein
MLHQPTTRTDPGVGLPMPLESEALALLRLFLTPVMEQARSWAELSRGLSDKGFGLTFRKGHLVVLNDTGNALCTGRDLGTPLASLSERIGRPCVRADRSGQTGALVPDGQRRRR